MSTTAAAYVGAGGSTGATSAGTGWTTLAYAEGSTALNYATWANTTSGAVGTWTGAGFGLSVPAGATIESVAVSVRHYETNTTRIASLTGQLFKGATALGSPATFTRATSARTDTFTYTVTAGSLVPADISALAVKVVATRSATTSAGNELIDWATVAVTYSHVDSPGLEASGFGTFSPIDGNDTISSVTVAINQFASTALMDAPTFELWDGTSARIGAAQTGTASTDPAHEDSATFTGVTYAQLGTLRVRIYAHSGTAATGASFSVDGVTITVAYTAVAGSVVAPAAIAAAAAAAPPVVARQDQAPAGGRYAGTSAVPAVTVITTGSVLITVAAVPGVAWVPNATARQDRAPAAALYAATATAPSVLVSTGVLPVGNPPGGPWVLAFEDHFDAPVDGKPDPAVWADHLLEGDLYRVNDNPSEVEWYPHNRAGLSVTASVLSLTARHENPRTPGSAGYDPACPAVTPSGNAATFTSGMIQSKPGFAFTYGYAEARIRLPLTTGSWPAFWMMGAGNEWPPEFDMMEQFDTADTFNATWHPESGGSSSQNNFTGGLGGGAWHTYGVAWSPTAIVYYWDGAAWFTPSNNPACDTPEHLILNLAVQANSGAGYPCSADIDYVRVWTKSGVPAQPVITSVTPATGKPTAGSLQVAFGAVTGATSYRAWVCPVDHNADGSPNQGGLSATGASSPLTVSGLTNGARYVVTVAALNATGYSVESLPVPAVFQPATAPATLAACTAAVQAATVTAAQNTTATAGQATGTGTAPAPQRPPSPAPPRTPASPPGPVPRPPRG